MDSTALAAVGGEGEGAVLVLLALALAVYLLPTLIAGSGHPHRFALFVINLLFGWTLVIWVGCLVWAVVQRGQLDEH